MIKWHACLSKLFRGPAVGIPTAGSEALLQEGVGYHGDQQVQTVSQKFGFRDIFLGFHFPALFGDSLLACDCSGAKADYVSLYLYNQIHDPNPRQLSAYGLDTAVGICYRVER